MEQLRISGKHLGDIAMPDYCEKCLWIKLKLGNNLPFQIFPGIFSTIDSYTKKVTNSFHRLHNKLPDIMISFNLEGKPVKVPHHTSFYFIDEETNIKLTGAPDEMLLKDNGDYIMLDYKTAKYTGNQDKLLPIYDIQLNAYSLIAEKIGMGKISDIGLIYFEPFTDIDETNVGDYIVNDGFNLIFNAKYLPMDLDLSKIPPLLRKIRTLYDRMTPPDSRPKCKDCESTQKIIELLNI